MNFINYLINMLNYIDTTKNVASINTDISN